jgi:predicted phage tail protein
VKTFYEKDIEAKKAEIEGMKRKLNLVTDTEKKEYKMRETRLCEEKQKLYREVHEKVSIITEIEIKYETLTKSYEQITAEL